MSTIKERKAYIAHPSEISLSKWIESLHTEAQKSYNETPDDHRYNQGRLTMIQEILKTVREAIAR